jgi:phosphomannomutase
MEDTRVTLDSPAYRCPGETHDIDRGAHLARLAEFYSGCRTCLHRRDISLLSPAKQRQWAEVEHRPPPAARFAAEALEADAPNAIDANVTRRFSSALGIAAWRVRVAPTESPAILVGSDGHWAAADLVSAACESLQRSGCSTIETGAVTSASLTAAMCHLRADVAMWVGNALGIGHSMSLKAWGRGARPWSSPGELDLLRDWYESHPDRPERHAGRVLRTVVTPLYLGPLRTLLHGLRPLRLVLDTASQAITNYLKELIANSACELIVPGDSAAHWIQTDPPPRPASEAGNSAMARRLTMLGRQVVERQAHFGVFISGDGEICRMVDERGVGVASDDLSLAMAGYICSQQPSATIVLHSAASAELHEAASRLGARTVTAAPTRQAMFETMEAAGAVFGCGPGGQFWFAGQPTTPDALLAVCALLALFSQSDRLVSHVLSG